MSDGMSDARDYGPSLSKHGAPILSKHGKPVMNGDCCEPMREAVETLQKHGVNMQEEAKTAEDLKVELEEAVQVIGALLEWKGEPSAKVVSHAKAILERNWSEEAEMRKRIRNDPTLKKIDESLQAIRDLSTKKEEPTCPKCHQPVDNVIHFCPK